MQPTTPFLAELDATTGRPAADQTFIHNASPNGTVEAMLVDGGRPDDHLTGRRHGVRR